jgi:hypothetical protein
MNRQIAFGAQCSARVGVAVALLALLLAGCIDTSRLEAPKQAIGKMNQITVVADSGAWTGPEGDSLRGYLEAIYPIMPEPEPMFDVQHYTPEEFNANPMRRNLRVLLFFADLSDGNASTTAMVKEAIGAENVLRAKEDPSFASVVGRDRWAADQLVIYLFGYGQKQLTDNVRSSFPAIVKRMKEFNTPMLEAQTYIKKTNTKLQDMLRDSFQIEMQVPGDYQLAIHDGNFAWLRKDGQHLNSNILVYKFKYDDKKQLSEAGLKAVQDEIGKRYITTSQPGAYMRINDVDLPVFYNNTIINNNFAIEARGIWETEGDFMGGPFLSYLVQTSKKDELVLLCGFVHAPGSSKRDYMQSLELVFTQAKM